MNECNDPFQIINCCTFFFVFFSSQNDFGNAKIDKKRGKKKKKEKRLKIFKFVKVVKKV